MANITPTLTRVVGENGIDGWQVKWGPMANGDVGVPVGSPLAGAGQVGLGFLAGYADKSVAITGTLGAAGSIQLEGSNDGTTFLILTDPTGSPTSLVFTALPTTLKAITEACIQVRPHVTAGDGTTALNAVMFFRKTQQP